jgi:hypothetical protein
MAVIQFGIENPLPEQSRVILLLSEDFVGLADLPETRTNPAIQNPYAKRLNHVFLLYNRKK